MGILNDYQNGNPSMTRATRAPARSWVAQFTIPITDPSVPLEELMRSARAELPVALAGLGLRAVGGLTVGLAASGEALTVRACVRVIPPRPRPSMRPVRVSRHQAHMVEVNARALLDRAAATQTPAQ